MSLCVRTVVHTQIQILMSSKDVGVYEKANYSVTALTI